MVSFKVNRSLLAGTLAAIGASVCCVGPLALLMLGISGAWIAHLSAFEPFRPWFVAATLLFLGLAFRKLYLQAQVCEPGASCADPAVLRRQRLVFWLVAFALLGLLSVPWVAPYFLLKELPMRSLLILTLATVVSVVALAASSTTAVLDVKNMSCGTCPITVKKSLEKVAGVTEVRVDFAKKTATVAFDASKTNAASLVKATTDAGFPATVRQP